jgi:hypothetical protein
MVGGPRMCTKKRTCVRQLIFVSLYQAQLREWGIRTGGPHGSLPVHEDDRSPKFRNTITYRDGCGSSLAELRPRTNCRRTDRSLKALAGLTGLALAVYFDSAIRIFSRPCRPQKQNVHRVSDYQRVSPDDVLHLIQDRDARERADTRTDAQRWLGDPPPDRSALAQRKQT